MSSCEMKREAYRKKFLGALLVVASGCEEKQSKKMGVWRERESYGRGPVVKERKRRIRPTSKQTTHV